MRDYTMQGVPVSQVSTGDLEDCLRNGIEIIAGDGCGAEVQRVMTRIELELYIRRNNLR